MLKENCLKVRFISAISSNFDLNKHAVDLIIERSVRLTDVVDEKAKTSKNETVINL